MSLEHKMKTKSKKINWNVVIYSFIALGFLVLGFLADWIFYLGAVFMIWLNQRELMKKSK